MFKKANGIDFRLIEDTHEISVGNQKFKLTPKETGVLKLLNDRCNTTVSRLELLEEVWGNKLANDQGITQAISRIRGILTQCRNVDILTIPKKGYQLQRIEPKNTTFPFAWNKKYLSFAIILLLTIFVYLLVYIQPIRIRIQKSTIEEQSSDISLNRNVESNFSA